MRQKGSQGLKIRKAVILILSVLFFFPSFSGSADTPTVYRRVPTERRRIALTFDDGPHPRLTPHILDILDRYGVHATFFMIGENVENYPDTAREVLSRGHEIGNHTYSHSHLQRIGGKGLADEIGKCEDTLNEVCDYRPRLFRPPEGVISERVENCCFEADYQLILWSLDTRDWEVKNAGKIAAGVLTEIKPGDIVLMHDYIGVKSKTPEALEILIPKLLAQGYEFVTVSELIGIG